MRVARCSDDKLILRRAATQLRHLIRLAVRFSSVYSVRHLERAGTQATLWVVLHGLPVARMILDTVYAGLSSRNTLSEPMTHGSEISTEIRQETGSHYLLRHIHHASY